MEFEYTLINNTSKVNRTMIVRNNQIIDVKRKGFKLDENEFKFIGTDINKYLELMYVWGHSIKIEEVKIVGLTDIYNLLNIVEDQLKKYIPEQRERMYVKLLYPDGHFGYIEYDGSEEDRFRIIKDHTDLFGDRGFSLNRSGFIELKHISSSLKTDYAKEATKVKKDNKFEIYI